MTNVGFYGETGCVTPNCKNRAYYLVDNITYLCGVHSKKQVDNRVELPKNPNAKSDRKNAKELHINKALAVNSTSVGKLCCYRMLMMKTVPFEDNWLNILPNRKALNRSDGIGMPSLSPMLLGPVTHNQPGLPLSKCIENYHQANKVWPTQLSIEIKPTQDINSFSQPNADWYTSRTSLYEDKEPHRHATNASKDKKSINKNVPIYSIHLDLNGKERRFSYVESRYFYCCAYELLATKTDDFKKLLQWHKQGVDIRICGYDGHPMGLSASADELYNHYCDDKYPFGHERVLYALISLFDTPEKLPWRRYRSEYEEKYKDIAYMDE